MKILTKKYLHSLSCLLFCFALFAKANIIQTNAEDNVLTLALGKPLMLQCNVTDYPDANVIWYKDKALVDTNDPRVEIFNENNSLVIKNPETGDTGKYVCLMMQTDRQMEGNVTSYIDVRMKPLLKEWGKSINIAQGGELKLHCEIKTGTPTPIIQWLKDGIPLNTSADRITVEADSKAPNARVIITDLDYEDRANYSCFAQNLAGNDSTHILVRVKDKYGALWPFIGICGEVAILCFIIFLYEKKRVTPDFDESDTDQQTENRVSEDNQKDKPQDVRQRK